MAELGRDVHPDLVAGVLDARDDVRDAAAPPAGAVMAAAIRVPRSPFLRPAGFHAALRSVGATLFGAGGGTPTSRPSSMAPTRREAPFQKPASAVHSGGLRKV